MRQIALSRRVSGSEWVNGIEFRVYVRDPSEGVPRRPPLGDCIQARITDILLSHSRKESPASTLGRISRKFVVVGPRAGRRGRGRARRLSHAKFGASHEYFPLYSANYYSSVSRSRLERRNYLDALL